jgi:hypothetical protein
MVLKITPDPGERMSNRDTRPLKHLGRPDSSTLKRLNAANRARRKDHFTVA